MQTQASLVSDVSDVAASEDPLAEIDRLMEKRSDDVRRSADRSAQLLADRSEFSAEFATICEQQVRPPMQAIIERLRRNGGGGLIEETVEDPSRHPGHRLTLWMSLNGEIAGSPSPDLHPYLQLHTDVNKRCVVVSEGDMWQGHGGSRSGKIGEWWLSEITAGRVTNEALDILRRSVGEPTT